MKSRAKIYITRQIPQKAIDVLLQHCNVAMWDSTVPVPRGELLNNVQDVDALLCMSTDNIDSDLISFAGAKLKVIGTVSEDCKHIDLKECQKRSIKILKLSEVSMETIADITISLLMEATQKWTGINKNLTDKETCNLNIPGSSDCGFSQITVGIIGMGELGTAVSRGLQSVGISKMIYSDPWREGTSNDISAESVNIDSLLAESDIICVCCKEYQNENNKILFHSNAFKKMKKSAILINAAKDHVINYPDLYRALRDGDIKAAGLLRLEQGRIPFNDPLFCLHNCFFTNFKESDGIWTKANKYCENVAKNIVVALQESDLEDSAEFAR